MQQAKPKGDQITDKTILITGGVGFIGSNTYIGPYTSIGDNSTILNTEIENSIIMEGAHIDCGRRITDSLIGRRVKILNHENSLLKGHRLILGDQSTITL